MRAVLIAGVILLVATLLLLWTPVTISAPVSTRQAGLLTAGLVIMVALNAVMLKLSFRDLEALAHRMDALDVLRSGDRLPRKGVAEMRALINGFNAMQDRLQAERLASIQRSVDTLERERRRISRELHDEIGQRVTGIALQLRRLHDDAPEELRLDVTRVQERARAVLDEIETLAWQIRPGVLDDLGLLQALEALASSLADNGTARIRTSFPRGLPYISNEAELAMYRIAQEALTNAMRHSEATSITVEVQVRSGDLILRITDNGRGRIPDRSEGPGLRGMRERALLIGARLGILENPPHGVRVELVVPVQQCVA